MSRSDGASKQKSVYQNLEADKAPTQGTGFGRTTYDRLQVLEDFLHISPTQSHSIDLRLKAIEEKLLILETKFPQIANEYLDYNRQGPHRGVGRTSTGTDIHRFREDTKKSDLFDQVCTSFAQELDALANKQK
jgi:hypothetical protein